MKQGFWSSDWFFGVLVCTVFLIAQGAPLFHDLETSFYDVGMRAAEAQPDERIAVIAIDEQSIENIGRWPWSRTEHARMIDILTQGGAKVIANTILFSEPQRDEGRARIEEMAGLFDATSPGMVLEVAGVHPMMQIQPADEGLTVVGDGAESEEPTQGADSTTVDGDPEAARTVDAGTQGPTTSDEVVASTEDGVAPGDAGSVPAGPPSVFDLLDAQHPLVMDLAALRTVMADAVEDLDTDARLTESLRSSGNVILPMLFQIGQPLGRPDAETPIYILRNAVEDVTVAQEDYLAPYPAVQIYPPIPQLGEAASALGHLYSEPDLDGVQRTEPLIIDHYGDYYPSMSLMAAARFLNLGPEDIQVQLGRGLRVGKLQIGTDSGQVMRNFFYGPRGDRPAFPVDSFYDVAQGRIPADKYAGKIVIIGATAAGIGDSRATPVASSMPPAEIMAHTVSAILNEDFFTRPDWGKMAELGVFALVALYLILLLPRMRVGISAAVSLVLLLGILGTEFVLLTGNRWWLQLAFPASLLVLGHLLMTIKMFRVTERLRFKSEEEGAESNKMLGLAFQGQGQLDMAFEKFRKCPFDESIADLLYNLALDYERKRQHNKAEAVYGYIHERLPKFKDVASRMKRAKSMSETVMLGGGGGSHPGGTLMLEGDEMQKPMLGRYQVEKELGKGAMGVVYLGRDPKINRVVAIKTMALAQEFDEDELEDVKERFFREAETAGRLNHPNIVTIFDAGEEHDLAYIAMEFLKGKDLVAHTKKDQLLSASVVLDLMAKTADALGVAHGMNIVHRDIKPANMMYDEESGSFKVTDFGIARITDSSKTKTGMVLGTPSYMSPEQLAGTKVDGRSDLFSLGVTMYQMLCGQLPFQADSMATLMYKIANEEHAPVGIIRMDLPECVSEVVDKALAKDMELRFQTGAEMAQAIRDCMAQLG